MCSVFGVSEVEFPPDMFLSPPGNVVPVHPETVEYAKKLLDDLSATKPPPKENRVVPPVPRFPPEPFMRKKSNRDLWGDSETDNISETDWEKKKADSSEGELSPVGKFRNEDISSPETGSETETESEGDGIESSGSNYETSSSFEKRKEKQRMKKFAMSSKRSTGSSVTSKRAAAGRKQKHQMHQKRPKVKANTVLNLTRVHLNKITGNLRQKREKFLYPVLQRQVRVNRNLKHPKKHHPKKKRLPQKSCKVYSCQSM